MEKLRRGRERNESGRENLSGLDFPFREELQGTDNAKLVYKDFYFLTFGQQISRELKINITSWSLLSLGQRVFVVNVAKVHDLSVHRRIQIPANC